MRESSELSRAARALARCKREGQGPDDDEEQEQGREVQGKRVCVKNVGANAFPWVAELFWLHPLLPDENMQVSGVRAVPQSWSTRLKCTVTTRRKPPDQPASEVTRQSPTKLTCTQGKPEAG
jgi:hypothetical protein